MKLNKTILLFLSFILTGVIQVSAETAILQNDDPILRKASTEFQALRYTSAIKELKRVLDKAPDNERAIEMMAASNRLIKNYDEALYWYGELCKLKHIKPEWALYYAEALRNKEKYEESEVWYRKYLSLKPADRRASAFSKANMNSLAQNAGEWKVSYTNINTNAAEYSPMYYKDGLLFISNRLARNRYTFQWDLTPYTDMYIIDHLDDIQETEADSSGLPGRKQDEKFTARNDEPKSLLSILTSQHPKQTMPNDIAEAHLLLGKVKSSYHEGPAVMLPEGSLVFTRNNYNGGVAQKSVSGVNKLKLYTATGDNWDKIISFPYNNNEYSTGHPAISPDGNILVFSSDMPRGYGGTDLYYCVRTGEGRAWGRPVNLGPKINTEGEEQFPFLDKQGKLYFSSTGFAGFGGLDIFEVALKDMKAVSSPRNMGPDINSSADDFGLIKSEDGNSGFFSSNRLGNDDIYQFSRQAFSIALKGIVLDSKTNIPLAGSRVIFKHNGITDTLQTNSRGEFTKALAKETDYELSGRKASYLGDDIFVSSSGITNDSTLNVVLKLSMTGNPQQWVIDHCDSLKQLFVLRNIYYDLDKSNIRPDAYPQLDEIAQIMKKHPEIRIISASHCDSRASASYNRDLSLRRGEAARAYLMAEGIEGSRIEVKYYGKSRLVTCPDGTVCSESEQQLNRRTEFEVVINGVNLSQLNCSEIVKR